MGTGGHQGKAVLGSGRTSRAHCFCFHTRQLCWISGAAFMGGWINVIYRGRVSLGFTECSRSPSICSSSVEETGMGRKMAHSIGCPWISPTLWHCPLPKAPGEVKLSQDEIFWWINGSIKDRKQRKGGDVHLSPWYHGYPTGAWAVPPVHKWCGSREKAAFSDVLSYFSHLKPQRGVERPADSVTEWGNSKLNTNVLVEAKGCPQWRGRLLLLHSSGLSVCLYHPRSEWVLLWDVRVSADKGWKQLRIIEYPKMEGIHKGLQAQLLAPGGTTQKSNLVCAGRYQILKRIQCHPCLASVPHEATQRPAWGFTLAEERISEGIHHCSSAFTNNSG